MCKQQSLSKVNDDDKDIVLLGDFNLPTINWTVPSAPTSSSSIDVYFLDSILHNYSLNQHVTKPTRKDNILDLVLSSFEELHIFNGENILDSDHSSLTLDIPLFWSSPCKFTSQRKVYKLKKADWYDIKADLQAIP